MTAPILANLLSKHKSDRDEKAERLNRFLSNGEGHCAHERVLAYKSGHEEGGQAMLRLLAEEKEGHLPRVDIWQDDDGKLLASTREEFSRDIFDYKNQNGTFEYLSIAEHLSAQAAAQLRIAELEEAHALERLQEKMATALKDLGDTYERHAQRKDLVLSDVELLLSASQDRIAGLEEEVEALEMALNGMGVDYGSELEKKDAQYISAVKGRQDFREALRAERAKVAELTSKGESLCEQNGQLFMKVSELEEVVGKLKEICGKDFCLEVIKKWQSFWMNQRQNSQSDYENYARRAMGVDANMKHDLANRLSSALDETAQSAGKRDGE